MQKIAGHPIIVIAGPTASGKSALAIDVAQALGGVVVNADSMQLYKGLGIISAVPSKEEQKGVAHRLYEVYEPEQNGTVVDWLNLAVEEIKVLEAQGKPVVVVGGTGLYIDNLINGTTPIPETRADIRAESMDLLEKLGPEGLYLKLTEIDAKAAGMLEPRDSTRVRRAYEIFRQTGISIAEWHQCPMIKKLPDRHFIVMKIIPDAFELDERCFRRFDEMLAKGAVAEVKQLAAKNLAKTLPAMKMLGVPELLEYLNHSLSLEEATELAKLHTRQYAKRQRTWFRNKLKADIELDHCYNGGNEEKTAVINNVKKLIKCCTYGD